MALRHSRDAFPAVVLLAALMVPGCSRLPDSAYTLRADAEKLELPAKHKSQIASYLAMFHGTPANPRMAVPDQEAVEQAAEAYGADGDDPAAAGRPADGVYRIAGGDSAGFDRLHLQLGRQIYTNQCAGCHGTTGDGKGPAGAHLNPPPRDYRNGVFKFTSTPRGSKPSRVDLRRMLNHCAQGRSGCAQGGSVPAVCGMLEAEMEAVIDYVMLLSARGQLEIDLLREAAHELDDEGDFDPRVVAHYVATIADSWRRADDDVVQPITVNPPRTAETIQAGAVAFAEFACVTCHAADARGSRSASVGQDIWGRTIHTADLSLGMLHGGHRPIDIYRRIYSGINGTPMPSAKDPNAAIGETPQQRSDRIWHLVHFVAAVIEGKRVPPDCQEVIYDVLQNQAQHPSAESDQPKPKQR